MEIHLDNITVTYNQNVNAKREVLTNISLKVGLQENIALIGPTGSGKSTLLKTLAGLIPPTNGKIRGLSKPGMVVLSIQEPHRGFFAKSVWEEVAYGPENLGLSKERVYENTNWALKSVGLSQEKWSHSPFVLSGGEQRRVALASVLSLKPKLLLLDEPTIGLDKNGKRNLIDLLQNLINSNIISTLVIASHEMDFLFHLTTRVIILNKGKIIADTCWGQTNPDYLEKIGLASPLIFKLLHKLNSLGVKVNYKHNTYIEAKEEIQKLISRKLRK